MKKPLKIIISIALAVSLIGCGTVFAMMIASSQKESNNFVPASVSCSVNEVFDAATGKKSSIKVQNTGNIDAYLRVCLVSYWTETEEGTTFVSSKPSELPAVSFNSENWIKSDIDNIYYYKYPVKPGSETAELLSYSITVAGYNADDGTTQVVEVFAEAIQALPSDSVTESWGVALDADGSSIKTVP